MKKIKNYQEFTNEEINWKKGLATAAIGASMMGGMTSCEKEVIKPNQEITNPYQSFSFGGEYYISKFLIPGGQNVENPRPDIKITLITKLTGSKVESQTITHDAEEDGIIDAEYNWGPYTEESGDLLITDSLSTKNATYEITTEDDDVWGKLPVLKINYNGETYIFNIGGQPDYTKFQIGGDLVKIENLFGVNKSFIMKKK